ncbi:enoyl- hydratase, partial [Fusarium albosuccineum]
MSSPQSFATPPPKTKFSLVSFPHPAILLVLINRPERSNSLSLEASYELDSVFTWFDQEPSCRVAIISGVGKMFCAGADLKDLVILEWMSNNKRGLRMKLPENGFGGLSFRGGKKPVIAAVNGPAYGGGCEMAVNCDIVVASSTATFGLPEVKRGVTPFGGVLPRLMKTVGRQRAAELALTGRAVSA